MHYFTTHKLITSIVNLSNKKIPINDMEKAENSFKISIIGVLSNSHGIMFLKGKKLYLNKNVTLFQFFVFGRTHAKEIHMMV